jgi:hypothetical protein
LPESIAYGLFRKAGLPAPRVAYANLKVNGELYGLYVQVEATTADFLKRWFEDAKGDLYEGPGDVTRPERLEVDSDPEAADREALADLGAAAETAAAGGSLAPLAKLMDLEKLAKFHALESLLCHWDGYRAPNNFRLYYEPKADRFTLIPHGADQVGTGVYSSVTRPGNGVLCRALQENDEGRQVYRRALAEILEKVWRPKRIRKALARTHQRILAAVEADPRRSVPVSFVEDRYASLLAFFAERRRAAIWQLAALEDNALAARLERLEAESGGRSPFDRGGRRR